MNKYGTRRRQIHRRVSEFLMQRVNATTSSRTQHDETQKTINHTTNCHQNDEWTLIIIVNIPRKHLNEVCYIKLLNCVMTLVTLSQNYITSTNTASRKQIKRTNDHRVDINEDCLILSVQCRNRSSKHLTQMISSLLIV